MFSLQGYGGNSSESEEDSKTEPGFNDHLKPLDEGKSLAKIKTTISLNSAPSVVTKVCCISGHLYFNAIYIVHLWGPCAHFIPKERESLLIP